MMQFFHTLSGAKDIIFSIGELMGTLIVGVILGVLTVMKKKNIEFKWKTNKAATFLQTHSKVHEVLTELRVLVRASRSVIFQFHNGGKFSDGNSIKRFSITHESSSSGVLGVLLESQDVLLTRYMEIVDLLEHRSHEIIRVSDMPESCFRSILEINNVVYFSVSPLKCADLLTPMGFVCCHWCDLSEIDMLHKEGIQENVMQDVIESSVRIINNHLIHAHK